MNNKTKKITTIALVAALYATLTLVLSGISYGPIQFRVSEVLTLLPLIGKEYIIALTIGCFLANIIGPYGVVDIVFGTIATLISVYLVYLTGKTMKDSKFKLIIASLWPTIVNAIIIGIMLDKFFDVPLEIGMIQVGFGQFVVITILGVPLFKFLEKKYSKLLNNLNFTKDCN